MWGRWGIIRPQCKSAPGEERGKQGRLGDTILDSGLVLRGFIKANLHIRESPCLSGIACLSLHPELGAACAVCVLQENGCQRAIAGAVSQVQTCHCRSERSIVIALTLMDPRGKTMVFRKRMVMIREMIFTRWLSNLCMWLNLQIMIASKSDPKHKSPNLFKSNCTVDS